MLFSFSATLLKYKLSEIKPIHDLVKLADHTKVELSSREGKTLKYINRYSILERLNSLIS